MADNYLEKRYAEVFGNQGRKAVKQRPSLDVLLAKNRSYRGYRKDYAVHRIQLEAMVAVNTKLASGMNAQRLRFRCITKGEDSARILSLIKLGSALPELHLPLPGSEPEAFIIVCSTCPENPIVDIDLGISLQSMLLKAVEMGLGGLIVRNFNPEELMKALELPYYPLAVLAVGKPDEEIRLVPAADGESLAYYRKDAVHYVPKLGLDSLLF